MNEQTRGGDVPDGYYYDRERAAIFEVTDGRLLPETGEWEYLGAISEMTPAEVVAAVEERYPDVSTELEFNRPGSGTDSAGGGDDSAD